MATFTDSVDENLDKLRELLNGIPPESRRRARRAASLMEQRFQQLRAEDPNDPAVALGTAFALFYICQEIVNSDRRAEEQGKGLIQLLS